MSRAELDARAEALGIRTSARWKDETVAEKIAEAEAAQAAQAGAGEEAPAEIGEAGPAGAADADPAAEPASGLARAISVTGPRRGRWRAGRHFTAEPVVLALADLPEAELAAIEADPRLTVTWLADE